MFDLFNLCIKKLNKQISTSAGCAALNRESAAAVGYVGLQEGCTEATLSPWPQFDAPCSYPASSVHHWANGTLPLCCLLSPVLGGNGKEKMLVPS